MNNVACTIRMDKSGYVWSTHVYLKGKKRERERFMFRSCHLALFLWIISISQSKYSKNKYMSFLEETRIKNFCRKKYRESRVVLQQYTHKLQHPDIATYSEITTFSRNQTKLQVFFKLQLLRSCNVLLSTDVL